MKIAAAALTAATVLLSGCVAPMPERRYVVELVHPFDADQAAKLMAEGRATVRGSGFLRQKGGGIVTCAGSNVTLIPATDYAKERIHYIYGDNDDGYATEWRHSFKPDYAVFHGMNRVTRCDAQGNFIFERVADGDFILTTEVRWQAGYSPQGGFLMRRVAVRNGLAEQAILTAQ